MTESQYAEACGAIMRVDLTDISDSDYAVWLQSYTELTPPESLVDYHHAALDLFEVRLEAPVDELESRQPYIRLINAVTSLDDDPAWLLEREFCIHRSLLDASRGIEQARKRLLDRTANDEPMTVEAYALFCADIKLTLPVGAPMQAFADHTLENWQIMTPPEELRRYHDAFLAFFEEWVQTGMPDSTSPRLQAATEAQLSLPKSIIETLVRTGCVGS